jgi:AraC-like DNA-binding protein
VGYNSAQSFIRLFKKYYNMTPVEFRRNLLNGLVERTSF